MPSDQKEYLMNLALGYQMSQVLFTAVSLDIFTLLDKEPQDSASIAKLLQVEESVLKRFAVVLVDLELLEKKNNLFYNTSISSQHLVKGKKGYLGNIIHHSSNLCEFWQGLDKQIRSGKPNLPGNDYLNDFPHRLDDYLSSMNDNAELKAAAISEVLGIQDFRKMLDIGCGPARYSILFSQLNPKLEVTLIDLEPNIEYARKKVMDSNLQKQIQTVTCQVLEDDIPGSGYDLIFISNLIHIYDRWEVENILTKAWSVLNSPGSMVIHDYIIDENNVNNPLFASLFDLTMFLGTPRGKCYTREHLTDMLNNLGVRVHRFTPLTLGTSLLVCDN
jgi:ubiquinone/menaquinone biosynthesis C-methylase UbiE